MSRIKLTLSLLALTPLSVLAQGPSVASRWLVSTNYFGTPLYYRLTLEQTGNKLTGNYRGYKLEGTLNGNAFYLSAKDEQGNTDELTGAIANNTLVATDIETDFDNKANPVTTKITAVPAPPLEHPTPQRHEFTPTIFYRQISALNKPVLTINPGDTIHTTTVDAGGNDVNGVKRSLGGNPPHQLSRPCSARLRSW